MSLFSYPKFYRRNYYERARLTLAWDALILFTIFFLLLGVLHFFNGDNENLLITLLSSSLSFSGLIWLKFTGGYKIVGVGLSIIALVFIQYGLFNQLNSERVIDFLWIVVISLALAYVINIFLLLAFYV